MIDIAEAAQGFGFMNGAFSIRSAVAALASRMAPWASTIITIRAGIAAALLVAVLGPDAGPANAAPAGPRAELAGIETVQVRHGWDRRRQSYLPRHDYRPRYRSYRHYYRPRNVCYTRYVVRYTYWGPQWVPVRSCYWR